MKKTALILSLSLFFPFLSNGFAVEPELSHATDAIAGVADESEAIDQQENKEQYRTAIEKLYPDYLKIGDDSMYASYVEDYLNRDYLFQQLSSIDFNLDLYVNQRKAKNFREIQPEKSKLDALIYEDAKQIYADLAQIESSLSPVFQFHQIYLEQIKIDQPFPVFNDSEWRKYQNSMYDTRYILKQQSIRLFNLMQRLDAYEEKIDKYGDIDSKKIKQAHIQNLININSYVMTIGHYIQSRLKMAESFEQAKILLDLEDEYPQRFKKLNEYYQSAKNQQKLHAILVALPKAREDDNAVVSNHEVEEEQEQGENKFIEYYDMREAANACDYAWNDYKLDQSILNMIGKSKAQYLNDCKQSKIKIMQYMQDHVLLDEIAHVEGTATHMNYLNDYRRYGDDIYYTNSESNALYRFNLKNLKEQEIYRLDLAPDDSGCDHNECRGVGATDVVLSQDRKTAYVASLDYDQVFAIDLSTQKVIQKYKVERYPRKLLLDEKGENLFVYNGVGNSISRIQLKSGEIKTAALPQNYQAHFCREIGMSFDSITGQIKVLGDWPNQPYIYMDPKKMDFWQNQMEIPYKTLSQSSTYSWVVEHYNGTDPLYGLYDSRFGGFISSLRLEQGQPNAYWTVPLRFGYTGTGVYFVENLNMENMGGIAHLYADKNGGFQDFYFLNIVHSKVPNTRFSFKLENKPAQVEAIDPQNILVLLDEQYDFSTEKSTAKKFVLYDLKSPQVKAALDKNALKLMATTKMDSVNLVEAD